MGFRRTAAGGGGLAQHGGAAAGRVSKATEEAESRGACGDLWCECDSGVWKGLSGASWWEGSLRRGHPGVR